jgi:hypothetical protein
MSRALRNGVPRMFTNHKGAKGSWFRDHYRALEQRLGAFDSVCREYAGAVAALWCEFRTDTLALESAEKARNEGQGRRPSTQAIARLKKRAALSWGSYDAALRRLEDLMAKRPRTVTFADTVRRQQ